MGGQAADGVVTGDGCWILDGAAIYDLRTGGLFG